MTTAPTMNEMLAANEKAKHVDAWRRYRTRLKDAAAVVQLDVQPEPRQMRYLGTLNHSPTRHF